MICVLEYCMDMLEIKLYILSAETQVTEDYLTDPESKGSKFYMCALNKIL